MKWKTLHNLFSIIGRKPVYVKSYKPHAKKLKINTILKHIIFCFKYKQLLSFKAPFTPLSYQIRRKERVLPKSIRF